MEKRTTTKEKKRLILLRLYRLWKQNPELRLAQLIGNIFKDPLYYIEDEDFIEQLEAGYAKINEKMSN